MQLTPFIRKPLPFLLAAVLTSACGGGGGSSNSGGVISGGDTSVISNCNNPTSIAAACDLRIYQIMVESFVNGDDSINYGVGYGPSDHKGDLQGIINSLDYIKGLGVNAIWLTPVFNSCGNAVTDKKLAATGYYACDYFNVDPFFGTNAKLKELVDTAHTKGLYVFMDGVFGHAITNQLPVAPLSGVRPTMKTASLGYTVDYTQANSVIFFTEVATHYITEYGIDGWRLDQSYQVPVTAWNTIRTAVENAAAARAAAGQTWGTLGYMVGEDWDSQANIATNTYGTVSNPGLKSAFDFPLHYGLVQAIGAESNGTSGDATSLYASWNDGNVYPAFAMPNLFLDNHDMPRFGDLLQRAKLADISDDAYWLRHKAAFSFMASRSGPITFFYGDEIGDEVSGFAAKVSDSTCASQGLCDGHVSRSDAKIEGITGFVANAAQADLRDKYLARLLAVRAAHPALYAGARTLLDRDSKRYVELKVAGSERILYLLNTGSNAINMDVSTTKLGAVKEVEDLMDGSMITPTGTSLTIPVPALTGRILLIK